MDNGAGGIELAVYSKVTGAGVLESSKLLTALQAASSDIQTSLGRSRDILLKVPGPTVKPVVYKHTFGDEDWKLSPESSCIFEW